MTFQPTPRYRRRLDNYLEWARCTTPMDQFPLNFWREGPQITCDTPEEAIFRQETHGENTVCPDPLFGRYVRGKANRDWWTKERAWWDHNASYMREEFVCHLTPECFLELFDAPPALMRVRWLFDNNYTKEDLEQDEKLADVGLERGLEGLTIAFLTPGELEQTRLPTAWERDNRYCLEAT